MKLRNVFAIFRKEVRDTLRDRRTLFVMTILPMLLYPVMIVGFLHVSAMLKQSLEKEQFKVWVLGAQAAPEALKSQFSKDSSKIDLIEHPQGVKDLALAFKEERVDAVLEIPVDFQKRIESGAQGRLSITYNKGLDKSMLAYDELRQRIALYGAKIRATRLERKKLARSYFEPISIEEKNLGQKNVELLRSLSMMLIIMALTGAFYPALDLGAGEKERGTLETLLLTPAARAEIAWGKYLAVMTLAVTAGLLNVASMALTFMNLESLVPADLPKDTSISVDAQAVFSMVLVLIPLVSLFSALALAVSTYAASYKEGQNYLSPLMMIVIFPAMAAALPGVTLSPGMCLVPVMGAAILFRNLLSESAWAYQVILVSVSNLFYAWLAIRWVATLYQREDVLMRPAAAGAGHFLPGLQKLKALFGSQKDKDEKSGWAELPAHLQPGPTQPTLTQSFIAFGLAFSVIWFVGMRFQLEDFVQGQIVSSLGVLGAVVTFALLAGCDWRSSFYAAWPGWRMLLAGFFLGLGLYCLNVQVQHWQQAWFSGLALPRLSPEDMKKAGELSSLFAEMGPWKLVFLLGVLPAICHEALFRGFVLKALRRDLGFFSAVLASAILGALLNFAPVFFLPTVLLGATAALLVLGGRSIVPAILVHGVAQGIRAYYSDPTSAFQEKFLIQFEFSGAQPQIVLTTAGWICGFLAIVAGGVLLIWQMRGKNESGVVVA
jgi:sodium transport system permease protein